MSVLLRLSKPFQSVSTPAPVSFRRFASHLCGRKITPEEFSATKQKVIEVSQRLLCARQEELGSWQDAPASNIQRAKHSSSGEFMFWRVAPNKMPKLKKSGELNLLNPDKLDGLVSAVASNCFPREAMHNVALYDEGCDNGDILGYALPWLIKNKVHTGVVLTNGHIGKLESASRFSNWITNTTRPADAYIHNAFDERIIGRQDLGAKVQKVFMIYHLGIVEKPIQISNLLSRRFRVMRPQDIALLTILQKDIRSYEAIAGRENFSLDPSQSSSGISVYQKSPPASLKSQLEQEGVFGEEQQYYISTFEPKAAIDLVESSGGTIITATTSEAPVEGRGDPVNYMNFVLAKK